MSSNLSHYFKELFFILTAGLPSLTASYISSFDFSVTVINLHCRDSKLEFPDFVYHTTKSALTEGVVRQIRELIPDPLELWLDKLGNFVILS